MFCTKCGANLPDDVAFCASCGTQLSAFQNADIPYKPAKAPSGFSVFRILTLAFTTIAFVFGFLPLIKASVSFGFSLRSETASLFTGKAFDIGVLIGIAKILMIIQIVLFVLFMVTRFVNFNKFMKLPFNVSLVSATSYFAVYFAAMILTFIGSVTMAVPEQEKAFISTRPAVCWYFAVSFIIAALVFMILDTKKSKVNA